MLQGKTAVITGCLQGIGNETMRVFAQNGCDIFACSIKKTEEYEQSILKIKEEYGVEIIPIYFDMLDIDSVKAAAKEIQSVKKPVDILVNIAGVAKDAVFQMVTQDQLKETFQINFFSQILFSQYIVKLMLRNGKGNVIFTSSITGTDGNRGQLAYGASKAAIISAVKTMSEELAPSGIRVNAVAPGVIKSPMTDVLNEAIIGKKIKNTKLYRIGMPSEVANLILFLASDYSDYITGQIIRIDGGIGS